MLKSENSKLGVDIEEINSLKTEVLCLKTKFSTLTIDNTTLLNNVELLSFSDAEKKESLRKELIAEKIAYEKEYFKRFIPPKRGLGYIGESSNKGKKVAGSCSSEVPKPARRKGSQGNSAAYKD